MWSDSHMQWVSIFCGTSIRFGCTLESVSVIMRLSNFGQTLSNSFILIVSSTMVQIPKVPNKKEGCDKAPDVTKLTPSPTVARLNWVRLCMKCVLLHIKHHKEYCSMCTKHCNISTNTRIKPGLHWAGEQSETWWRSTKDIRLCIMYASMLRKGCRYKRRLRDARVSTLFQMSSMISPKKVSAIPAKLSKILKSSVLKCKYVVCNAFLSCTLALRILLSGDVIDYQIEYRVILGENMEHRRYDAFHCLGINCHNICLRRSQEKSWIPGSS